MDLFGTKKKKELQIQREKQLRAQQEKELRIRRETDAKVAKLQKQLVPICQLAAKKLEKAGFYIFRDRFEDALKIIDEVLDWDFYSKSDYGSDSHSVYTTGLHYSNYSYGAEPDLKAMLYKMLAKKSEDMRRFTLEYQSFDIYSNALKKLTAFYAGLYAFFSSDNLLIEYSVLQKELNALYAILTQKEDFCTERLLEFNISVYQLEYGLATSYTKPIQHNSDIFQKEEEYCNDYLQKVNQSIAELEDDIATSYNYNNNKDISSLEEDYIDSKTYELNVLEQRRDVVLKLFLEIQKCRYSAYEFFSQYVAGTNQNAPLIETTAKEMGISSSKLSKSSKLFFKVVMHIGPLEMMENNRVIKNELEHMQENLKQKGNQLTESQLKNEEISTELNKKNNQLGESKQKLEEFKEKEEYYKHQLRERDLKLKSNQLQLDALSQVKQQQEAFINQMIEIWNQQQKCVQKNEPLFAHAEHGMLLATAVQRMLKDFDQHMIRDRSAHILRSYLQELIQAGKRDYSSSACKQAIAECNQYLRGTHPRQANLDAVFQNPAFYSQTTALPLEETVLAFDAEGQQWWWLRYVFLLLETEPSHEIARSVHHVIHQTLDIEDDPDFSAFLKHYQLNPALQEAVQTAFHDFFDKREQTGIG